VEKERPILVTGATGYLASWIIKYLLETGHNVTGADRSGRSPKKDKYEKLLGLPQCQRKS
jgi:nucleoside-diphosphate-sugar epimerase